MIQAKTDRISGEYLGTGRRKTSVARVRIKPGSGAITVNNRPMTEYFVNDVEQRAIYDTLDHVGQREAVDVSIRVSGGGTVSQSGAAKMAIARALSGLNEEFYTPLRDDGFLTRDSRMKERKKYGLRGARRGVQFSKR